MYVAGWKGCVSIRGSFKCTRKCMRLKNWPRTHPLFKICTIWSICGIMNVGIWEIQCLVPMTQLQARSIDFIRGCNSWEVIWKFHILSKLKKIWNILISHFYMVLPLTQSITNALKTIPVNLAESFRGFYDE